MQTLAEHDQLILEMPADFKYRFNSNGERTNVVPQFFDKFEAYSTLRAFRFILRTCTCVVNYFQAATSILDRGRGIRCEIDMNRDKATKVFSCSLLNRILLLHGILSYNYN